MQEEVKDKFEWCGRKLGLLKNEDENNWWMESRHVVGSDVVFETKVLVSRRLEDRKESLGLCLCLEEKVLHFLKDFSKTFVAMLWSTNWQHWFWIKSLGLGLAYITGCWLHINVKHFCLRVRYIFVSGAQYVCVILAFYVDMLRLCTARFSRMARPVVNVKLHV